MELSRVPVEGSAAMPSLTAGVEPLETEADTNRAPWELAVLFDESDAVRERDLPSAAAATVGCALVSMYRVRQVVADLGWVDL